MHGAYIKIVNLCFIYPFVIVNKLYWKKTRQAQTKLSIVITQYLLQHVSAGNLVAIGGFVVT
jgi:hypothetical protein